jgi:Mg2+ and Co2+ transporter CorA
MSSSKEELKHRVLAKKHQLQERLEKLQAEALGSSTDEVERLQTKLNEAEDLLSQGWDNLSGEVTKRLNDWLK